MNLSKQKIDEVVCGNLDLPVDVLYANTRKPLIVEAKQLCMVFRFSTGSVKKVVPARIIIPGKKEFRTVIRRISLQQTANEYGFKTHCQTLYAIKAVESHYECERIFRERFHKIKSELSIHQRILKAESCSR